MYLHSVILHLITKNKTAAAIHQKSCEVLGEDVMSEHKVRKWCVYFWKGNATFTIHCVLVTQKTA